MATQVQLQFDAVASGYDAKYHRPRSIKGFEKRRRMEILCRYAESLQPTSTLDAGCGSGMVLDEVSRRLSTGRLVGVDFSASMLRQARAKNLPNVEFVQASVERLPFPDDSFDLIYALGVLDYLEHPSQFFRSVHRLLKPSGHFVFTYPNGDSVNRTLAAKIHRLRDPRGTVVTAAPVKNDVMERLMAAFDFQLVERHYLTYGNGFVSLPWSVGWSRTMERMIQHRSLGRYLAWSCLCLVRKGAS